MARYRSRRYSRRSASQSAANLLALALPAPLQRVSNTRLGSLLMLVGVPSMLVAGLLQINWSNGLPTVAVDPHATATVLQRTREGVNNFEQNLEQQGGLSHLASDLFNGVSHSSHEYNYGQGYPTAQQTTPTRVPTANFPSTQPQATAAQRDYRYTTTQPTNTWGQSNSTWGQQSTSQQPSYAPQPSYTQPNYSQPNYAQSQNYSHQPTYAQQPTYSQPTYSQSGHQQPTYAQPTYSQSGYQQQAASPSDARNLTQQQLYQQQQYQQQQYQYQQQQLNEQYRQFQASQQHNDSQQSTATRYQQQYDSYGRPVSTGYAQPTNGYSQPATQYGQQNYNQGYLPNANTHGRY